MLAVVFGVAVSYAARTAGGLRPSVGRASVFGAAALGLLGMAAVIGWGDGWWLLPGGCALGLTAGWGWQWGCWGKGLVIAGLLGLPVVIGLSGLWIVDQALVVRPTPIEVNATEKRRLMEMLRQGQQQAQGWEQVCVDWSQRDLTLLANWGLATAGMGDATAKVTVADQTLVVEAVVAVQGRWIKVGSKVDLAARDGHLVFDIESVRLGNLAVPDPLTRQLSGWLNGQAAANEGFAAASAAIESLAVSGRKVSVCFVPDGIPEQWLRDVGASDKVPSTALAVRPYFDHLLQATTASRHRLELDRLINLAFGLAQERSLAAGNATRENAAAIVAVATFAGHPRIGGLYRLGLDNDDVRRRVLKQLGHVRLHGRNDLARHFWVSAAVTVIANPAVSDMLGLLKEELDSGQGGSGFSFVDLMADRAGTRFAEFATADQTSAQLVQQRLTLVEDVDWKLMPEPRVLPEGLSETELVERYGGIGGPGYRALVQQIEARLDALILLQSENARSQRWP